MRRAALLLLLVAALLVGPAAALDGWDYAVQIDYSPGSGLEYEQDIVIHRAYGDSHEVIQEGETRVWHIFVGDRCRSDYGDIRFTVGETEIPYYRWPGWTAQTAEFSVRLPQHGPVKMWYSNDEATSTSDGPATFILYEDFEEPGTCGFTGVGTTYLASGVSAGFSGYGLRSELYSSDPFSLRTRYWEARRDVTLPDTPVRISVMSMGAYGAVDKDPGHGLAIGDLVVAGYTKAPGWREIGGRNVTSPGTHPVRLLSAARWRSGTVTSYWDTLVIRSDDPEPPAALSFSGSPAHIIASPCAGPAPLLVRITDSSSAGDAARYWDFGDYSTSFDPGHTQYHVYTEPGTYTINLSILTPAGTVDHATATVRVVEGEPQWGVYRDIVGAQADRGVGAYGAIPLPDGGAAWVEMTLPVSALNDLIWSAEPQYWRVVRADASGSVVWISDEISSQRPRMTYDGGSYGLNAPDWYDPKIMVLNNGNLMVCDGVPGADLLAGMAPAAALPPQSWLREIDIDTGATVWTIEISGWGITGVIERPEGGFWAAAASAPVWYKPQYGAWRVLPPEASYILGLDGSGSIISAWRVHTEPSRVHSMSHPFAFAPVAGSDGDYWVFGWQSIPNRVYDNNPYYHACLQPQIDRVNPVSGSDARYPLEPSLTADASVGSIPRVFATASARYAGYWWGRPNEIMRLSPTSDGGALVSYSLIYEPIAKLVRVSSAGEKLWTKTFASPVSGAGIPVMDVVELPDGVILVLLQDGDMIRVSRLDAAGNVQQTAMIGDPGAVTTARRITAAPTEGHPYGCIISGSTSGFGASGTDAIVIRLNDLEDIINLGSGALVLDTDTAYTAEDVRVTAALDHPLWDDVSYWISIVSDDDGRLYETVDLTVNQTSHTLGTHAPPGNYTLTLNAYSDAYGVLQALATAHLLRLDVGEVSWDRTVTYLGESPSIGYSYVPDYERYSYWIEIRDPDDLQVEIHRLPTPGAIWVNPENMTEFGAYTAEIFPLRKSDEMRIPGNTSTTLLSDETWLSGTVANLYHVPIPGATVTVRQPTHPDPEVAARVLSGTSDADGWYTVSGLTPRYPANVTVIASGHYDHPETIGINISGRIYYPVYMTAIPPRPLPEIVGKAVFPPRNNPAVGFEVVLTNATTMLVEIVDDKGHFAFPPLQPDIPYTVHARNSTGHTVSETHTYALARGQTVDLLLLIRDESLLPKEVDFVADPTRGDAPLRVVFQATGQNVTAWHWDFGRGSTGAGQTASHTYRGAGIYTVTLTAENYYGVTEVTKTHLISVSGSGGVPVQAPVRFVIQSYAGQPLANVTVTATPLESTGPLSWLYDLFGVSGDADINGTVLSGSTDTGGGIVLPLFRTVKYRVAVTDLSRGIDTEITIYPTEDEVVLTVWPQEPSGPANDFQLYAREEGRDIRVGVRYATSDLTRITFTVSTEAGDVLARKVSTDQAGDLTHVIDGRPGEVYIYGYVAEHRTAGVLRQDQYVRFAGEDRPWVDFADWIPLWAYRWAAIAILVGFSWTFGRGEIRGAMLTIPIIAGILQVIGWLQIPWIIVGVALVIGVLVYMRLSEDDLRI